MHHAPCTLLLALSLIMTHETKINSARCGVTQWRSGPMRHTFPCVTVRQRARFQRPAHTFSACHCRSICANAAAADAGGTVGGGGTQTSMGKDAARVGHGCCGTAALSRLRATLIPACSRCAWQYSSMLISGGGECAAAAAAVAAKVFGSTGRAGATKVLARTCAAGAALSLHSRRGTAFAPPAFASGACVAVGWPTVYGTDTEDAGHSSLPPGGHANCGGAVAQSMAGRNVKAAGGRAPAQNSQNLISALATSPFGVTVSFT